MWWTNIVSFEDKTKTPNVWHQPNGYPQVQLYGIQCGVKKITRNGPMLDEVMREHLTTLTDVFTDLTTKSVYLLDPYSGDFECQYFDQNL